MARQTKLPFGPVGITVFPLLLLALVSWVVALAGVSALQYLNESSRQSWQVRMASNFPVECARWPLLVSEARDLWSNLTKASCTPILTDDTWLQFDWWIVLLNLVAFCLVGVYTILGPRCSNIGVVALLAVVTTLNMIRCDGELWLHCYAISRCRIFSAQAHLP